MFTYSNEKMYPTEVHIYKKSYCDFAYFNNHVYVFQMYAIKSGYMRLIQTNDRFVKNLIDKICRWTDMASILGFNFMQIHHKMKSKNYP